MRDYAHFSAVVRGGPAGYWVQIPERVMLAVEALGAGHEGPTDAFAVQGMVEDLCFRSAVRGRGLERRRMDLDVEVCRSLGVGDGQIVRVSLLLNQDKNRCKK